MPSTDTARLAAIGGGCNHLRANYNNAAVSFRNLKLLEGNDVILKKDSGEYCIVDRVNGEE